MKTAPKNQFEHYYPARQHTQEGLPPTQMYEEKPVINVTMNIP